MAIEKKSLINKKAAASTSTPTKKAPKARGKMDTSKPAASKVLSALKVYQG